MARRQIDSSSAEWNSVDFQLQLITGKSSIKLINLFKLSDDPIHQQIFKTDAVINATDFNKDYIDKVRTKTIPLQDLMVFCGHVNIHSQAISNKIFTFLIGKVALGRRGTSKQDVTKLDSILIENQNQRNSFQYNFFLRSHEQYHLRYEAYFTVGEERQFNPAEYRCASCQNKQAVLYCRTQKLYFCESCNIDHHRSKILQGHQLQKIDKINTLPMCKNHNQRFSIYCLRCQKYLCSFCIQKGGSHGNSDHPVYPIQQIYEQKREINELLAGKQKQRFQNLLRSVQLKREEIVDNYGQVKRYIEKQKERAIQTLDQLMLEKSLLITSDQLQLKMLNQKLDWAKAFVKFQEKTLKPIHYFHSQHRFERDLQKSKIGQFESIYNVKGDLAVEGEIVVARKQVLDRAKNQTLKISTIDQRQRQSRVSNNLKQKVSSSRYAYDASAQAPQRGQLCTLLQTSQLNFFTFNK